MGNTDSFRRVTPLKPESKEDEYLKDNLYI